MRDHMGDQSLDTISDILSFLPLLRMPIEPKDRRDLWIHGHENDGPIAIDSVCYPESNPFLLIGISGEDDDKIKYYADREYVLRGRLTDCGFSMDSIPKLDGIRNVNVRKCIFVKPRVKDILMRYDLKNYLRWTYVFMSADLTPSTSFKRLQFRSDEVT